MATTTSATTIARDPAADGGVGAAHVRPEIGGRAGDRVGDQRLHDREPDRPEHQADRDRRPGHRRIRRPGDVRERAEPGEAEEQRLQRRR